MVGTSALRDACRLLRQPETELVVLQCQCHPLHMPPIPAFEICRNHLETCPFNQIPPLRFQGLCYANRPEGELPLSPDALSLQVP
jgi:hypothetical protein